MAPRSNCKAEPAAGAFPRYSKGEYGSRCLRPRGRAFGSKASFEGSKPFDCDTQGKITMKFHSARTWLHLVMLLLVAMALFPASALAQEGGKKPNIVFIM